MRRSILGMEDVTCPGADGICVLSLMDRQQHGPSMTEDQCGSRHRRAGRASAVIEHRSAHRQTEQIDRAWRGQCGAFHCQTGRVNQASEDRRPHQ